MNYQQAIERARAVIRRQHKALATEDAYIFWLRRYTTAVQQMPRGLSSEKQLEHSLTDLARARERLRQHSEPSHKSFCPNHSASLPFSWL